jgi:hypothetical protein
MNCKSIYALRAHQINDSVKIIYNKLVADLGYENVVILYDATYHELIDECNIPIDNICILNDDICLQNNSMHNKIIQTKEEHFSMNYYHPETGFVLLAYWATFIKKMDYDFIWFIEYDVYCKGNFKIAFDKCDSIYADLMARGRDQGPEHFRVGFSDPWCFWNDLVGDIAKIPCKHRVGCFFPLVRFSKRMIDTVKNNFNKSTGFCEVYIPTLAVEKDLIVEPIPLNALGVYRFKPIINFKELIEFEGSDVFFHPVK